MISARTKSHGSTERTYLIWGSNGSRSIPAGLSSRPQPLRGLVRLATARCLITAASQLHGLPVRHLPVRLHRSLLCVHSGHSLHSGRFNPSTHCVRLIRLRRSVVGLACNGNNGWGEGCLTARSRAKVRTHANASVHPRRLSIS